MYYKIVYESIYSSSIVVAYEVEYMYICIERIAHVGHRPACKTAISICVCYSYSGLCILSILVKRYVCL